MPPFSVMLKHKCSGIEKLLYGWTLLGLSNITFIIMFYVMLHHPTEPMYIFLILFLSQGNGASWCNGDCHWKEEKCQRTNGIGKR